jgi:hypothetical protein
VVKGGAGLRRIAIIVIVIGAVQLGYGIWAGRSDLAAAPVYRSSPSCGLVLAAPGDACRREVAMVVERKRYSSSRGGGTTYWLTTVTPDGTRDHVPLAGLDARPFWSRVKPTQRISLLRFIAPGYHLTGSVMAFADDQGIAFTRYNPDSGTHYDFLNILMGGTMGLLGVLLLARRRA